MRFVDTETTGLHGVLVLLQVAKDDEDVTLYCPWTEPAGKSIALIEEIMSDDIVGFNWSFDQFHIQKIYNMLQFLAKEETEYAYPDEHIAILPELELKATVGDCLKPKGILDLMTHSRKGPFQSLMNRRDVRIRSVPELLCNDVKDWLDREIILPDVLFHRKSNPSERWKILPSNKDGFVDIVLKFAPSSSLKALALATGITNPDRLLFDDVSLPEAYMSKELGWAPFALSPRQWKDRIVNPSPKNWYGSWPEWIHKHIEHWTENTDARQYAIADVEDTRALYRYFDSPPLNDTDSILAAMVGSVRWRGFALDLDRLQRLQVAAKEEIKKYRFSYNSAKVCKRMLTNAMTETETKCLTDTSVNTLSNIAMWEEQVVCDACFGDGCNKCVDGLVSNGKKHPAAGVAGTILEARKLSKKIQDLDKLLRVRRFHPDFNVIGTKSSRMSGTGGLNAQGINADPEIRKAFTFSEGDYVLCGGDFSSFEVTIMEAEYKDKQLREDLLSDRKIHAVLAQGLYDLTYEEAIADKEKYGLGKRGVFALAYGGDAGTISRKCHVSVDKANEGYNFFVKRYPGVAKSRIKTTNDHACLKQKEGGGMVTWVEPKEYVESMLGFRRYFTTEYMICRKLYELASNPPKEWDIEREIKVQRREKLQTPLGSVRTALFATAFAISGSIVRAAVNHKIQSPGATITKELQAKLWELQPYGSNPWIIACMQVHDELLAVVPKDTSVRGIVDDFVIEWRDKVQLLNIEWKDKLDSWAGTH